MSFDPPRFAELSRAEEAEIEQLEREEAAQYEEAERLTVALEKLLDEGDFETKVQHPHHGRPIAVGDLLDSYLTDYLDESLTVARALIAHGAGNGLPTQEILDGFSHWYHEELMA